MAKIAKTNLICHARRWWRQKIKPSSQKVKPYLPSLLGMVVPVGMTWMEDVRNNKEFEMLGVSVTNKIVKGYTLVIKGNLALEDYPRVNLLEEAQSRGEKIEKILEGRMNLLNNAFDSAIKIFEKSLFRDDNNAWAGLNYVFIEIKTKVLEIMQNEKVCASEAINMFLNSEKMLKLKNAGDDKFKSIYEDIYRFCAKVLAIKHHRSIDIEEELNQFGRENVILVINDIAPTDLWLLNDQRISAVIREKGSPKDHFSLLLAGRERAGLVQVKEAVNKISSGQEVIVDGRVGKLIISPSFLTQKLYSEKEEKVQLIVESLKSSRGKEARSLDGFRLQLMANISNAQEIDFAIKHGMDGIGLVRTELFFMEKEDLTPREAEPEIEEQIDFYQKLISSAENREIIIRTIDPDKDKSFPYFKQIYGQIFNGENKGLAICLDEKGKNPYYYAFINQMRALLQTKGKVRIMFPMVTKESEFLLAMSLIDRIKTELEKNGKKVNREIEYGLMVEHPRILEDLPSLARDEKAVFFSIGTNDLIQYLTGVDRYSEIAARYFNELDPRVLAAISRAIELVRNYNKEISLCGDMGNNWMNLLVLLGLGLRKISFHTGFVDLARTIVQNIYFEDLNVLIDNLKLISTGEEIRKYVREFTKEKINSGRWGGLSRIESILFEEST